MTDSMGSGKLVRHLQNPSYTYDEYLICIGLGPSISSVICKIHRTVVRHIQVHLYCNKYLAVQNKKKKDKKNDNEDLITIVFRPVSGNTSLNNSAIDWLSNLDQLKESVRLAGSYDWQNIDITQFQSKSITV